MNEPHCGINIAYLPLKKGINRLVALNGHHHVDGEPSLLHCFLRWVSELAEASKKLFSAKETLRLLRKALQRYLSKSG